MESYSSSDRNGRDGSRRYSIIKAKCMSDYKQGVVDCLNGLIPKNGMSDEYYVGYSEQYAKEQQLSQGNN